MGRVKDIVVKVIPRSIADPFVRQHHYSGKVDTRTQLSFGAFLDGKLHGVMQLGPSINKKASINVCEGLGWNEFIELARMAFDDYLPKNSESRCIAIMLRMLKKQAPQIKLVISYADGTQCGDGTIYRASGFKLYDIKKNTSMWEMPDKKVYCSLIFNPSFSPNCKNSTAIKYGKVGKYASWSGIRFLKEIGAKPIEGYQLKYIYFLDKEIEKKCKLEEIPFSKIAEMGASMYKGKKINKDIEES